MGDAGGMSAFVRDVAIRATVAALVGAAVSGGIIYFAFDQSLRGVEAAISVTNDRLGSVDSRLAGIDERLRGMESALVRTARDHRDRDDNLLRLSASARETLEIIEALGATPPLAIDNMLAGKPGGLKRLLEEMSIAIDQRRDNGG